MIKVATWSLYAGKLWCEYRGRRIVGGISRELRDLCPPRWFHPWKISRILAPLLLISLPWFERRPPWAHRKRFRKSSSFAHSFELEGFVPASLLTSNHLPSFHLRFYVIGLIKISRWPTLMTLESRKGTRFHQDSLNGHRRDNFERVRVWFLNCSRYVCLERWREPNFPEYFMFGKIISLPFRYFSHYTNLVYESVIKVRLRLSNTLNEIVISRERCNWSWFSRREVSICSNIV